MIISIIVAMAQNGVIGINNSLPWKLSEDLKRFKQLTLGTSIIMGRKTFESIGRPLPGRENIVITHQKTFHPDEVKIAHSLKEALELAQNQSIFVIGGAQIYEQAVNLSNQIYLTLIEKDFDGDTYFPEWDKKFWQLSEDIPYHSEKEGLSCRFQLYLKK